MPGNLSFLFFLLFCYFNLLVKGEKNESTFVPSREWQPVKKGQPIPSGLHVRHNFQTGLTEAKLVDEEYEKNSKDDENNWQAKSLTLHPDESVRRTDDDAALTSGKRTTDDIKIPIDELKTRLKKIKLGDNEIQPDSNDERSDGEAADRFQSYKNLKNEFKALEVNVTTDAEMIEAFFKKFESHRNSVAAGSLTTQAAEDVLQILNNLEYLLHQIDNAQTFADTGGMAKIISPCFNATNNEIKAEALRLLGTAVQSNPKVQAKALEHDFVQKLLHILVVNNKVNVQSRCLFALSALIRQYPAAQKALVVHGGLDIFGKILEDGHRLTQSRVMRLMSDLVVERAHLNQVDDEVLRRRKTREYANTEFEEKLWSHNYCKHLSNLMVKIYGKEAFKEIIHSKRQRGNSIMEDYDFLEVIIESMINLCSICKRVFGGEIHSIIHAIAAAIVHHYNRVKESSSYDHQNLFEHLIDRMLALRTNLFQITHDEL